MIRPIRLQLSRQKGFNLQEISRAANGLEAVNVARPSRLASVAMTCAPSRMKASALALPMPCAAAVMSARFPANRPDTRVLPCAPDGRRGIISRDSQGPPPGPRSWQDAACRSPRAWS